MKWFDLKTVFGLIVVLLSIVTIYSHSIFTGLGGYGINLYAILINGFVAAGLAIVIFLIDRQKMKRKEKFGNMFILGRLDSLIFHLEVITEEITATTRDTDEPIMDSYTNKETFELAMKLRLFNELNWFKDVLPVFSDAVDFNEWHPLYHEVIKCIQRHNKQIKLSETHIEHYRIIEKAEDYETMKKVFKNHYEYWKKYKPKDYSMNFATNPKYPNYLV